MLASRASRVASLLYVLLVVHPLCAEESSRERPGQANPEVESNAFRLNEMIQAAADLRQAGEAFDRFGGSLDRIASTIAEALATMSSEFDPFGYKTAFRTVGRQAEMIQQQHEIIQALQKREIKRLRRENTKLRKELRRSQKQQAMPEGR